MSRSSGTGTFTQKEVEDQLGWCCV